MAKVITYSTLTAPINVTAAVASGGSLVAGSTYYYCVIAVFYNAAAYTTENGRSLCSIEVNATTDTVNKTINLTWDAVPGAGGYRVYRCKGESIDATSTIMNTMLGVAILTNSYSDNGTAAQQLYHTLYRNDMEGSLNLSGGTSADPITITDIYNADIAGGWNKIIKLSAVCFDLRVSDIVLSSANTYVRFSGNIILLLNSIIRSTNLSTTILQFGLRNSTYDSTSDGCVVSYKCANALAGTVIPSYYVYVYDTTFIYDKYSWKGLNYTGGNFYGSFTFVIGECQDVVFKMFRYITANTPASMKDIRIIDGGENAWNWSTSGIVKDIKVETTAIAVQYSVNSAASIDGLTIKKGGYIKLYACGSLCVITVKNSLVSAASWYASPLATIKEQFDFNCFTKDNNGLAINLANVLIKNINGTTIFSGQSDINGIISMQGLISRIFTFGNAIADPTNAINTFLTTITSYSPYTITVSKAGYETFTELFSVSSKINKEITLKPITKTRYTFEGKPLRALNPESGSSSKLLEL